LGLELNHVGAAYGMMDEVFQFVATFKDYPPRSFTPSFNPANILGETLRDIESGQKLKKAFPMLRHGTTNVNE
jgi:arylsulfatase